MTGPLEGIRVVELGCGWPDRRLTAFWPTGVPTSSRSNRPPATRAGLFGAMMASTTGPARRSTWTTAPNAASCSDLTTDGGQATARQLIAGADVFHHQRAARMRCAGSPWTIRRWPN